MTDSPRRIPCADTLRWHVAQCRPRCEFVAKMNITEMGLSTFLPTIERRRSVGRRAADLIEPLFPGYLFVAFDPRIAQWRKIAAQRGVLRMLCHGDRPDTIPTGVIDGLRELANQDGLIIDERPETVVEFMAGEWLRLTGGPFAGHSGLVGEDYDGGRCVSLLLSILGAQRMMRVPLEHVLAST